MSAPTTGTLHVPGATLYYEVRGRGPLLLLIPGGTGGAAAFDGVADALAAEYTVASYDPRGLSRSPLDEPEAGQSVAEHAEDALRLLDLLSPAEPARVFGSSSGAIAALHLLTARPERLVRLVAHEPPVVEVLPDAPAHRAFLARVRDTLDAEGLMPAMGVFAAGLRKENGDEDGGGAGQGAGHGEGRSDGRGDRAAEPPARTGLPPAAAARVERTMADLPYFLGRIVPSFMAYSPDLRRLEAVADRLVLAGGRDSRGELPYRPAAFLAERFGRELLHFPGGHTGLSTHPAEFGGVLRQAFGDQVPRYGAGRSTP